jgi:tetratricopeptide (TPR) repeat protein
MTLHPRIPALAALVLSSALGLGIMAATGQFRATNLEKMTREELEKRIVDCKDAAVWIAYGDKLQAANRFTDAVLAYEKALALQPEASDARISIAIALGRADNPDKFFAYFSRLTSSYPKLALGLLENSQLSAVKSDLRWEPAAAAARAQAVD